MSEPDPFHAAIQEIRRARLSKDDVFLLSQLEHPDNMRAFLSSKGLSEKAIETKVAKIERYSVSCGIDRETLLTAARARLLTYYKYRLHSGSHIAFLLKKPQTVVEAIEEEVWSHASAVDYWYETEVVDAKYRRVKQFDDALREGRFATWPPRRPK